MVKHYPDTIVVTRKYDIDIYTFLALTDLLMHDDAEVARTASVLVASLMNFGIHLSKDINVVKAVVDIMCDLRRKVDDRARIIAPQLKVLSDPVASVEASISNLYDTIHISVKTTNKKER